MFYIASIYATLNLALLLGALLTFGMAGFLVTFAATSVLLVVGAGGMLVASEMRKIAANPEAYNPRTKQGMSKLGWSRLV